MVVFEQKDLRISLITSRLLRTEKGVFTDMPTQTVQNRDFDAPRYELTVDKSRVNVRTDDAIFSVRTSDGNVTYAHFGAGGFTKKFGESTLDVETTAILGTGVLGKMILGRSA